MLAAESAVTTAEEEGCSRGELIRLKKVWPPSR
jgi:hypothetical protein